MTGLSARGITVLRGKRMVLEDVSFSAPSGAVTALLGGAGSGKTTLLATLAGLLKPERGTVMADGTDVTRTPQRRRNMTLLAPGTALPDSATLTASLRKLAGRSAAAGVEQLLQGLGLDAVSSRQGSTLSHGEALLALTAARLTGTASTLLLDEAAMGLDDASAARLWAVLRDRARAGDTILVATRSASVALQADHLVLLESGRIQQAGMPASLYAEPRDTGCALLTGPANILSGQIRELRPGAFVWSAGGRFPQAAGADAPRPSLGSSVTLCLRPERIALLTEGEQADNEMSGEINTLRSSGALLQVGLTTQTGSLAVCVPSWSFDTYPALGHRVRAGWSAAAAHVLAPD